MNNHSNTLKSLAFVKANWDLKKKDFLSNFVPFLCTLLYQKKYQYIDESHECINKITEEVKELFGINFSHYSITAIIKKAVKKGLLKKESHRFIVTEKIYDYDFTNKINEQIVNYNKILEKFIEYANQKYKKTINHEEAEKIIISFLKRFDLDILFAVYQNSPLPNVSAEKQDLFILYKFIEEKYKSDYEIFRLFLDFVIGHILTSAIFYGDELKEYIEPKLKGLNLYLDTRLIFQILGTEGEVIQSVVKKFINELLNQGINLYLFSHTYNELFEILQTCLNWVENPQYDPQKASPVLKYFKSEGFKQSDVTIFINSLDKVLKENKITKIESPDYQTNKILDESSFEKSLIDVYKKFNPQFDEETKGLTIQRDIRSISAIYLLRKNEKPINIKNAKHAFVTTNSALAYVAREYEKKNDYGNCFPACLTDTFIGTLIWLRSPNKVIDFTESKLIVNIQAALNPAEDLLKKYILELEKLKSKQSISDDDYILLRDSQVAMDLLEEKTLGDPKQFTQKTPFEILDTIKNEAEQKYRFEKENHEKTNKRLTEYMKKEEEIYKHAQKMSNRIANVLLFGFLLIFLFASIFSKIYVYGFLGWLLFFILLVFSFASLLGLSIKNVKDKLIKLIMKKVFNLN